MTAGYVFLICSGSSVRIPPGDDVVPNFIGIQFRKLTRSEASLELTCSTNAVGWLKTFSAIARICVDVPREETERYK